MPRKVKEMSAVQVKRLSHAISKETGKPYNAFHAVGGVSGLILQVSPSGAKSWLLRTHIGGKRVSIGLGGYPDITLAIAKDKARDAKEKISLGINPIEEKRQIKRTLQKELLGTMTFKNAMYKVIEMKAKESKSPRYYDDKIKPLEKYAVPVVGDLPVREIDLAHVKAILEPIWETRTETASRLRALLETILGWCTVQGFRDGENPARWKGHLDNILPSPAKIKKVKHHQAIKINEMPQFMAKLVKQSGTAAKALEFTILTACRTNEVIGDKRIGKKGITWQEVDFDKGIWTIPAERMKAQKSHTVPLSKKAIQILKSMPQGLADEQIFKGQRSEIPSDQFMTSLLKKRMGINATVHGFRSTFKDWAREHTNYPDELSELALAHVNSDATRAAYARSSLVQKRLELMQEWEQFCHG